MLINAYIWDEKHEIKIKLFRKLTEFSIERGEVCSDTVKASSQLNVIYDEHNLNTMQQFKCFLVAICQSELNDVWNERGKFIAFGIACKRSK